MGLNQPRVARASKLVTSQRLLLVVVALALAAYAASTWYTRHMLSRVNDATDAFAAESVYGLANISAARETLWKVDSLLHREVQHSTDLDLKTQVDELRSELGTEGDRLVGERPERDDLGRSREHFLLHDSGGSDGAASTRRGRSRPLSEVRRRLVRGWPGFGILGRSLDPRSSPARRVRS